MSLIRRIITEVHRRSLWQVLAIFLATGWGVLQVLDVLIQHGIVPDWVFRAGFVLLLIGLPIVLATAFVQEGMPGSEPATPPEKEAASPLAAGTGSLDMRSTRPPARERLFTWRNAIAGGVGAFALLAVSVVVFFGMRAAGIGPAASLAAQGVFAERETVVLAEFGNSTQDTTLGRLVTEALRIDLLESRAVTVLTPARVAAALQRSGRSTDDVLTPEVARDIAQRDNLKAIVQGDVGAAGGRYVLTASIVEANGGAVLAAFRETAASESELLPAIDRLSRRIREKAGESLRSVRTGEPLSAVTTTSLEALRAYATAEHNSHFGDMDGAIRLMQSATELDPTFAMAHRRLGTMLNFRGDVEGARAAATRAYELRSRLTRTERLLTEAFYHTIVSGDRNLAIDAYREVLRDNPGEQIAVHNLAALLNQSRRELEEAVELHVNVTRDKDARPGAYASLISKLWDLRMDDEEIGRVLLEGEQRFPDNQVLGRFSAMNLVMKRSYVEAIATADSLSVRFRSPLMASLLAEIRSASELGRGRLNASRRQSQEAMRLLLEMGGAAYYIESAAALALAELLVGRSPERARAVLRDLQRNQPFDSVNALWGVAAVGLSAALAGDTATERRARTALERIILIEGRTPERDAALAWHDWAAAIAREDGAAALAAAEKYTAGVFGDCKGRRCIGYFERGLALEQLQRMPEAITAYEEHLGGVAFGQTALDATFTPLAMERLGELYEQQGNATRAAEYYGRFAELWKDADPELQPRVRRARERAAALLAPRG